MAKLDIIVAGNPVLRLKAKEVERIDKKTVRLLNDMAETMYAADGVGLAAPQVGVSRRIVVIDVGEGLIELINPVITKREGSVVGGEVCFPEDFRELQTLLRPAAETGRVMSRVSCFSGNVKFCSEYCG